MRNFTPPRGAIFSLLILGLLFAIFAPRLGWINSYVAHVLITIGINIILCVSLNLVNGYMGEFSIGHAGFMSLGAYTSVMITTKMSMPGVGIFLPSVLAGGIVAAGIGFLLALLSIKTRGDYLAIITLAFLMIVKSSFENLQFVGGPRGVLGISHLTTVAWTFLWVVIALWSIRNLVYSKFGRAIVAIREDEIAANAMAVRTREAKIVAFVVSSFFAGIAGALFAHQILFINPSTFDIVKSTEILVMVYLGGIGSITGSLLGAVIFTFLSELLLPLGTWRLVILSLLLVLLMLFRPKGLFGLRELKLFVPRREWEKK